MVAAGVDKIEGRVAPSLIVRGILEHLAARDVIVVVMAVDQILDSRLRQNRAPVRHLG